LSGAAPVFPLFEINQPNANSARGLGSAASIHPASIQYPAGRSAQGGELCVAAARTHKERRRRRPYFPEFRLIGMRWRIEFRLLADYISGKLSVAESTEACLEIRGLRRANEQASASSSQAALFTARLNF